MLAAADPETPMDLRLFAAESARLYPEFVEKLQAASGINVDFRRQGTVVLLESVDTPPGHIKLSVDELTRLEPALQAGEHSAFFLQEDSVDPDLLLQAAVKTADNVGVGIRHHTTLQKMCPQDGNVEVTADRERFVARVAVNCQGAWAGAPVRPRKGQMCYLHPQNSALLNHVVRAPEAYLVPRSSGKILVGATVEDAGFDKSVEPQTIGMLHRAASVLIPELASAPVVQSWAGLRPGTPDDLPIMGETGIPGILVSSGHFRNGILLAPAAARVMADLIMGRSSAIDISSFSPTRFAAVRG